MFKNNPRNKENVPVTQTESIIGSKLQSVQEAIVIREARIKELQAIERVLVEITTAEEAADVKEEKPASLPATATIKDIIMDAMDKAGRPVTIREVEDAVRIAKGTVRRQGIYSTLHEMAKHKEAKRVRAGLYRSVG